MALHYSLGDPEPNERAAIQSLLTAFSNEWALVTSIPRFGRRNEIDALLVGRRGLVVIEFKNYRTKITARYSGLWDGIMGADKTKNPMQQALKCAQALKSFLQTEDQSLAHKIYIGSVVILSHPSVELECEKQSDTDHVGTLGDAIKVVERQLAFNKSQFPWITDLDLDTLTRVFRALGIPVTSDQVNHWKKIDESGAVSKGEKRTSHNEVPAPTYSLRTKDAYTVDNCGPVIARTGRAKQRSVVGRPASSGNASSQGKRTLTPRGQTDAVQAVQQQKPVGEDQSRIIELAICTRWERKDFALFSRDGTWRVARFRPHIGERGADATLRATEKIAGCTGLVELLSEEQLAGIGRQPQTITRYVAYARTEQITPVPLDGSPSACWISAREAACLKIDGPDLRILSAAVRVLSNLDPTIGWTPWEMVLASLLSNLG